MDTDNINEKCKKYGQKHIIDYIDKINDQKIRA